jgi:GT2 family glycosyltransferase
MIKQIAVLITCHNRKSKTITCLAELYNCELQENYYFDVFLVDDGSTDGTAEAVKNKFPKVKVIQGSGNLYWNRGMRLAWETAAKTKDYDFYLWLNDDTVLDDDAIIELIDCNDEVLKQTDTPSVIVGSCRNDLQLNIFSYGGRTESNPVIPNGKLQKCKYINGNVVLIPKEIFDVLGNLSSDYTHAIGDNDYGLRAIQAGYTCYITKKFIAVCPINEVAAWQDPNTPLIKRFKLLYSPKGLNMREYIIFRKKFEGKRWIIFAIKVYLKTLSPTLYKYLSKKQL